MTDPTSSQKSPAKARIKPQILRWRVGQYTKTKRESQETRPCPNYSATRSKPELCVLCKRWHPVLAFRLYPGESVQTQLLLNLGSIGSDPFRRKHPEDDLPVYQQIIHDSITFGWKNLVPIESSPGYYPWVATCYDFICHDDTHYYSNLYAGLLHMHIIRNGPMALRNIPRPCLEMKIKTLQFLQMDMDQLGQDLARDSLLSSIYVMAHHEPNLDALNFPPLQYPSSPMANFQLLQSVGMMKSVPTHYQALYYLVAQRGGIHRIQTFGVANQLATGDLVIATLAIAPPGFECYWSAKSMEGLGCSALLPTGNQLLNSFGVNFESISGSTRLHIEPFLELLPAIKDATIAIDHFHHTAGQSPRIWDLIDLTDSVHYKLLCLQHSQPAHSHRSARSRHTSKRASKKPSSRHHAHASTELFSSPPSPSPTLPTQSLQILRLATLIYSDLVIFPLAFESGIRFRLARRLYTEICTPATQQDELGVGVGVDVSVYLFNDARLEMWVLSMGYVACLPYYTATKVGLWLKERLRGVIDFFCVDGSGNGSEGGRRQRGGGQSGSGSEARSEDEREIASERRQHERQSRNSNHEDENENQNESQNQNQSQDEAENETQSENQIETGNDTENESTPTSESQQQENLNQNKQDSQEKNKKQENADKYPQYLSIMQTYLWWKPVCDAYAVDLWGNLYDDGTDTDA